MSPILEVSVCGQGLIGDDPKIMTPGELHRSLAAFICAGRLADRPVIVGINGVDGSGKTTLSINLTDALLAMGVPVCRISVDDFLHPREHRYRRGPQSPRGYYEDSVDYEAIIEAALKPAFNAEGGPIRCKTKHFDLINNKPVEVFEDLAENSCLLIEGIFLFRLEIIPFLHIKIFVDADFEAVLNRVMTRDRGSLGDEAAVRSRYERKYIPGQKIYLNEDKPADISDIVVDNNNYTQPTVMFR